MNSKGFRLFKTISIVVLLFTAFSNVGIAGWSEESANSEKMMREMMNQPQGMNFSESGKMVQQKAWTNYEKENQRLSKVEGADKIQNNPSNGWSGGADMAHPSGNNVLNSNNPSGPMPLGNKEMAQNNGTRTLSSTIPFGDLQGTFLESAESKLEIEECCDDITSVEAVENQIKNWTAKEGLTLREVIIEWAEKSGWEIIWKTNREYPLKASAIFRGRFKDVTSAVIKSFSRANPPPRAQFYLGNKVIVIKTLGDDNG